MNAAVKDIFWKSEGRYLEESEVSTLLAYGESLLSGLDTMQAVERAEPAILDEVVREVLEKHPAVGRDYGPKAEERVRRDQAMVLRYATSAMLLGDPNFIYDKLAVWARSILFALCKPDHVLVGYYALMAACRAHLAPADADAVVPYIQVLVNEFEQNKGRAA